MADSIAYGGLAFRKSIPFAPQSALGITITGVNNIVDGQPIGDTAGVGYTIAVTGSRLTNVVGVAIVDGGTSRWASNVTVVSDSLVTCTAPSGTIGLKDVAVATATTTGSMANAWRYWDPSAITTTGWWRETMTTSLGNVTQWTDKSGNARHLTPPGTNPTSGATMNGQPTVDFDGTNQYLTNATAMSSFVTNTAYTAYMCFVADAIDTNSSNTYDNDALFSDSAGYIGVHLKSGSNSYTAHVYNFDGTDDQQNVTMSPGNPMFLEVRHDSGNIYIRKNSDPESSATASGNTQNVTNGLVVGHNYSTAYFNGRMSELFFVNSVMDATTRGYARSYFATRYNISPMIPAILAVNNVIDGQPVGDTAGLGYLVAVTGSYLSGAVGVSIGGNWATGIVHVNDSILTCVAPSGTLGLKNVVVANTVNSGTYESGWRYWDPSAYTKWSGWWRETMTTGGAGNGNVVQWTDKSGAGRHLVPAASAPEVGSNPAKPNGQPHVHFSASLNQSLSGSGAQAANVFINSSSYTSFLVAKPEHFLKSTVNSFTDDAMWGDVGGLTGFNGNQQGRVSAFNWDGTEDNATLSIITGSWTLFEQTHASGSMTLRAHNKVEQYKASGDSTSLTAVMQVGKGYTSSGHFSGSMAELCFTPEVLDPTQRSYFRSYARTRYGLTGSDGDTFQPSDILDIILWVRADDIVGSPCSQMNARTNTTASFVQATASKKPTVTTSALFNNQQVLSFDGSDDTMSTDTTLAYGPFTMFWVAQYTTANYLYSRGAELAYGGTGPSIYCSRDLGFSSKDVSPASNWPIAATAKTFRIQFNGTVASHKLYINGTEQTMTTNPGTADGGTNVYTNTLEYNSTGGVFCSNHLFAEMLIYNRLLTTDEISLVEMYLRRRYAHY